ncbi:MAG TPA: TetR/AcrR family transcriptional regulator [Polyangiales bacterium]
MSIRTSRAAAITVKLPKRDAILRAALEVFAELGVHGVAVPEIAERAGVGTGTIYRFFESKEELINEVFREQKRELGKRLRGLSPEDPRAAFDEFWRRVVKFVNEEPYAFRFLELHDHQSYLDDESRALERKILEPMVAAHRALQKRGVFRKDIRPEVAMSLHWGAIVNLFKAERSGYLSVKPRDVIAARDACWRLLATQAS